jgi:hypothetical protein
MKKTTRRNRYGTIFTFTELKDGNIQWSGDFSFSRNGFANDYNKAWAYFKKEYSGLDYDAFVEEVHRYDRVRDEYIFPDVIPLIETDYDVINMVDPSGGPYMVIGSVILDRTIAGFKKNKEGYLIITE